jgi:CrcB protein
MVAVGGAAGSVIRYGVQRLAIHYVGPATILGTLSVNVTGSFALGFVVTLILERIAVSADVRTLVTVGFLGGYTTFSTLSFETVQLLDNGEYWRASWSLMANVVLGLGVAYMGVLLARAV